MNFDWNWFLIVAIAAAGFIAGHEVGRSGL